MRLSLPALALLSAVLITAGCETPVMMREKGDAAFYAGNYDEAHHQYNRVISHRPTDHRAQFQLGETYMRLGQPRRAQIAYERAYDLRKHDPEWNPRILDRLAESIYQQDRPERLQAFLEDTVREHGTTRDRLRQAEYLVRIGDLDGARLAYRQAAFFSPADDPRPYLAVADFYESLGDTRNAIRALRWAHFADPRDPDIAERLRRHGITPGPTAAEAPPKPELLR